VPLDFWMLAIVVVLAIGSYFYVKALELLP
jgi:hypothetical protein